MLGELDKYDAKNKSIEKKCVFLQKFSVGYVRGIKDRLYRLAGS